MTELIFEKVVLTADQERGMQELLTWWKLPKSHPQYYNCIFSAPAGCGKTFLAKYFTRSLKKAYPCFTATTNEAARQLELAGVSSVKTTHSALGLIPSFTEESAKFYQALIPQELSESNILVIDEASMAGMAASDKESKLIIDYVLDLGMRTLWLGDWYQLPPVESDNGLSPIFEQGFYTVELTEVVRNSGDILQFCTSLRQAIDLPVKRFPKSIPKEVKSITFPNFYKLLKDEAFLYSVRKGKTRIIVWRNITADIINSKLREGFFGADLAKKESYLPTDQILFTKPLIAGNFPAELKKLHGCKTLKQVASINSKAEILNVKMDVLYSIPCYSCTVRIERGIEAIAWIPTREGKRLLAARKAAFKEKLKLRNSQEKKPLWEQWHFFENCFAQVKHSYAITTHRSQGSTIENIVVDTVDILLCARRSPLLAYKMLYTACSRAKASLTLIRG